MVYLFYTILEVYTNFETFSEKEVFSLKRKNTDELNDENVEVSEKKKNTRIRALFYLAFITSLVYITWRIFFTVPTTHGLISTIIGIALVVAEAVACVEMYAHFKNMVQRKEPEKPVIPNHMYPNIDVFVATHSEPVDVVYKTVNGCCNMDYPDKSKVHIFICDDTDRKEMKELADEFGVGYLGLSDNKDAKAGNLNNAISKTTSPLIATFDADMIPTSEFLMETTPYFALPLMKKNQEGEWVEKEEKEIDENEKVGFIQTPQSFYNADLFQSNLRAQRNVPNEQDYFFKDINVGRNRTNSAIYAGSNTLISRQALEDVGGITTGTITEDFATGIRIQEKGYLSYAIKTICAHGLAPNDFKSLIKQRQRWGRGCVQSLRSFKFLFSKLPIAAKFSYLTSYLYWWTFLRRFIFIVAPLLASVFGIIVVECSLWEILIIWLPSYILYARSLRVLSSNIRTPKWSNITDTIIFPYLIIPIIAETFGITKKKFEVTAKKPPRTNTTMWYYGIPHMILFIATLFGLVFCIYNIITQGIFGYIIFVFWLSVNSYFLFMATLFMMGYVNYRDNERFYSKIKSKIATKNGTYECKTMDISENGIAFLLDYPVFVSLNEKVEIELRHKNHKTKVKADIIHVTSIKDKWKYSFKVDLSDSQVKRDYFQVVYDRDHTLPTEIKSNLVNDVISAVKRKTFIITSQRHLPRMVVDYETETIEKTKVTIVDYNYNYMLVKSLGNIKKKIEVLVEGQKLSLKSNGDIQKQQGFTLYEVDDWENVAGNSEVQKALLHNYARA
jgi:cellulose synthase (UDP-forming)